MDDYKDDDDDDEDADKKDNKDESKDKVEGEKNDADDNEKSKEENKETENEDQEEKKPLKEKKQLTFTEQAARRTECRRLKRFVKLVDYITVNTLHMLILDSTRSLLGYIFDGCTDDDVAFQNKTQKNEEEEDDDDDMYGDNQGNESDLILKSNSESQHLDEYDSQALNNVQIGGAYVGKEVKTSDLIKCGYQNFFNIITELKRETINIYMELIEEYDDPISLKLYLEEQKKLEMKEKKKEEEENTETSKVEQSKKTEEEKKKTNKDIATKERKPEILSLFHIELLLNTVAPERNLYFNPPLMDFINSYDNIIKLFISLIESFQLLSNTIPYLEDLYLFDNNEGEDNDAFEGSSVVSIILEDNYFRELVGRIRGVFVGVFDNAFNWMKQWEGVRSMWVENESFEEIDVQKLLEIYKPPDFTEDESKDDMLVEGEEEAEPEAEMEVEEEKDDAEKEGEGEGVNEESDKQLKNSSDYTGEDEVQRSKFVDYFEDSLKNIRIN